MQAFLDQIRAALAGAPIPHDLEAMQRIHATTERAESDARRAERGADDYWLLRYLEQHAAEELEAVVLDTEPRTVVQLTETLRQQPMPSLTDVEPGQTLRVRIDRVNPRANLLILRRV